MDTTNLVLDYIRATTNLYGIVPLEKVVEIYNEQNEEPITSEDLEQFKEMEGEFFEYFDGCFVHDPILDDDSYNRLKAKQADKPYYIPSKQELLKYADDLYVDQTDAYQQLYSFILKNLEQDPEKAESLTEDIQFACLDFSLDAVFDEFNRHNVSFESEAQLMELMPLINNLANNTRIWSNRGHTPDEIFERFEKPNLRPLPPGGFPDFGVSPGLRVIQGGASERVGRNEPCPCGSGKKYKKCCIDKEPGKGI